MDGKILIADNDSKLIRLMEWNLDQAGYQVFTARDGLTAIRSFYANSPDLAILGVAISKLNGFELCQRIRDMSDTPIILLTGRGRPQEIIRGLELGIDDYLPKPFDVSVLLARVRATLRRAACSQTVLTEPITYRDSYLSIDVKARRVTVAGKAIKLTAAEYRLLALLIKDKGCVLEYNRLLQNVWGSEYTDDFNYLNLYIWHLRRKLEPNPQQPIYLLSEPNLGYRFQARV